MNTLLLVPRLSRLLLGASPCYVSLLSAIEAPSLLTESRNFLLAALHITAGLVKLLIIRIVIISVASVVVDCAVVVVVTVAVVVVEMVQ